MNKKTFFVVFFAICLSLPIVSCSSENIRNESTDKAISASDVSPKTDLSELEKAPADINKSGEISYALEDLDTVDIAALIGEKREIMLCAGVSDTTLAIVSGVPASHKTNGAMHGYFKDLKIDLINITNPSLDCISHKLTDIEEQSYRTSGCNKYYIEDNHLILNLYAYSNNMVEFCFAWYDITINSDNITDTLTFNNYEFYNNGTFGEPQPMQSKSGQYKVVWKNENLYIHNNYSNKDILVYLQPKTNDKEISSSSILFDGDILYYHVWEEHPCIFTYDPKAGKSVKISEGLFPYFYNNGYIYGKYYEDYFARINIKSPENIEKIFSTVPTFEKLSSDGKYIAGICSCSNESSYITIYETSSLKKIISCTSNSDKIQIYEAFFVGDYIVISSKDNKAYIIKFK